MSFSESISPLIGRLMFAWFFLTHAFQYLRDWDAMVDVAAGNGLPAPPAFVALAVLIMICAGSSLLIGFQTRVSAMVLAVCTLSWAFLFHDYWNVADPALRAVDKTIFSLGVAVTGGLLVLVGLGGGRFSFNRSKV